MNKTKLIGIFILMALVKVHCAPNKPFPFQLTWAAEHSKSDSVVLKDQKEEGMLYYGRIEIYRKDSLIYQFHDSVVEIEGSAEIFTEHMITDADNAYLIFRCDNRPNVENFLVIKKAKGGYEEIGYTPSSSAEVFGDIDFDGKFEIGGFENLHEWGKNKIEAKNNIKREFKVFEVGPGFPIDKELTQTLLPIVLRNSVKKIEK